MPVVGRNWGGEIWWQTKEVPNASGWYLLSICLHSSLSAAIRSHSALFSLLYIWMCFPAFPWKIPERTTSCFCFVPSPSPVLCSDLVSFVMISTRLKNHPQSHTIFTNYRRGVGWDFSLSFEHSIYLLQKLLSPRCLLSCFFTKNGLVRRLRDLFGEICTPCKSTFYWQLFSRSDLLFFGTHRILLALFWQQD